MAIMVAAIRQTVTVKPDGTIELRSPELRPGEQAEVIVLLEQAAPASPAKPSCNWRKYAGAIKGGNARAGDNQGIDVDLTRGCQRADPPGQC